MCISFSCLIDDRNIHILYLRKLFNCKSHICRFVSLFLGHCKIWAVCFSQDSLQWNLAEKLLMGLAVADLCGAAHVVFVLVCNSSSQFSASSIAVEHHPWNVIVIFKHIEDLLLGISSMNHQWLFIFICKLYEFQKYFLLPFPQGLVCAVVKIHSNFAYGHNLIHVGDDLFLYIIQLFLSAVLR